MSDNICPRCGIRPRVQYKTRLYSYCRQCKNELNSDYSKKYHHKKTDEISRIIQGVDLAKVAMLEALPQESEEILLAVAKYVQAVDSLIEAMQK